MTSVTHLAGHRAARRLVLLKVLTGMVAVVATMIVTAPPAHANGTGIRHHALGLRSAPDSRVPRTASETNAGPTPSAGAAGIPMAYGGGPVLTSPRVYLSYWGPQWQSGFSTGGYTSAQAQNYLGSFFAGVGGTRALDPQQEYCMGVPVGSTACPSGAAMAGNPSGLLRGTWLDSTPVPSTPTDPDVQAAADRAFQRWGDLNGVYFVISPSQHSEAGFGTQWCAWHSSNFSGGKQYAYTYLPYMPDAGGACGANYVNAASNSFGNGYFDGLSIVGGHEFSEAVTDPFPNSGWIDANLNENADKCSWSLGSANGGPGAQNVTAGSNFFAVQPTWSNLLNGCAMGVSAPLPPTTGPFVPLSAPVRILDTRTNTGGHRFRFGPGESARIQVAGASNGAITVPSTGLGAAVINATITGATAGSYLTLFPAGGPVPLVSNLNFGPGQQLANLVTVALPLDGYLGVYNNRGTVDVILDLEGYFSNSTNNPNHAGLYNALPAATRMLDTRSGLGGSGRLGPGRSLYLQLRGASGVPANAAAVSFNLTAVCASGQSYLAVLPQDGPQSVDPAFSNVNFSGCTNTPNRVISNLSAGGGVTIFNSLASVDVVVDVTGWFTDSSNPSAAGFNYTALSPFRVLDTRRSAGAFGAPGYAPVDLSAYPTATSAVLNVTGVAPSLATVLTVYPSNPGNQTPPGTSDLNISPGMNMANLCLPAVGANHIVNIWNDSGVVNAVVDLAGYFG